MRVLIGLALLLALLVGAVYGLGPVFAGCPAALDVGSLVAQDGQLVLDEAVTGGSDRVPIRWPVGFGARRLDDGRLAVTDVFGGVKAVEGDPVALPGGESLERDGSWQVCGSMDGLREPPP